MLKRIVGIDYGKKRIGIALSDERKILARGLQTLLAEKKTEATIDKMLAALAPFSVQEIVVGLPLKMSGQIGLSGDEVQHFVDLLRQKTAIPVVLWDERLTTVQAERSLKEGNLSRKKRSLVVDQVAAIILLQSYLDSLTPIV